MIRGRLCASSERQDFSARIFNDRQLIKSSPGQ